MASRVLLQRLAARPLRLANTASSRTFTAAACARAPAPSFARRAAQPSPSASELAEFNNRSPPAESVSSSTPAAAPQASPASAKDNATPFSEAEGSSLAGAEAENGATDWSRSYHGLSQTPFPKEASDILLAPVEERDIEMKPGSSF